MRAGLDPLGVVGGDDRLALLGLRLALRPAGEAPRLPAAHHLDADALRRLRCSSWPASVTGEPARFALAQVSTRSLLALAYLIVFGSIVAFTAYVWLLRTAPPVLVSTYAYVNPVVAVFLGWALAGEPFTKGTLIAAAVILIGVALISSAQGKKEGRRGAAGCGGTRAGREKIEEEEEAAGRVAVVAVEDEGYTRARRISSSSARSAGTGSERKKPWPYSQPRARSLTPCPAVWIPSATTSMPS